MAKVVVIGGGVSGLATAALLASRGEEVELFEARSSLGGRAGLWERDGFRFDTGPSWYLMPEVFDHFFKLLNSSAAEELDLVRLEPAYRVFSEGFDPFDVESGRDAATALFESIEPGAGPKLDSYLDSAAKAYRLALKRFLYDSYRSTKGLRQGEVLAAAPKLLPLLLRSLASFVESKFSDIRLRQTLEYPAVFLGGSPYEVPALYHLMSHLDLDDGVLYPQGGMFTIVAALERLALANGVVINCDAPVRRILRADGAVTGVQLADGTIHQADSVVAATDLHHLEEQLLGHPPRKKDKREPSPGALLLLLGVSGEVPELAHHTLLFASKWRENFDDILAVPGVLPEEPSLYICAPSKTDASVAPAGDTNLFVLVPAPADPNSGLGGVDGAGDVSIEARADQVIAQISSWCQIPDLAERVVVRRTITPQDFAEELHTWRGNALGLAHTLKQSAFFRPGNTVRGVRGLYRVGSDVLPGVGLPMCLISAEIVTKLVLGDDSPGPLAEPGDGAAFSQDLSVSDDDLDAEASH